MPIFTRGRELCIHTIRNKPLNLGHLRLAAGPEVRSFYSRTLTVPLKSFGTRIAFSDHMGGHMRIQLTTIILVVVLTSGCGRCLRNGIACTLNAPQRTSVLKLNVASLAFGAQDEGSSSTRRVTVTNSGGAKALQISASWTAENQSFAFGSTGTFPGTGDERACGASLEPRASCLFDVRFTPGASGETAATLNLSYSDGTENKVMALGVTGRAK